MAVTTTNADSFQQTKGSKLGNLEKSKLREYSMHLIAQDKAKAKYLLSKNNQNIQLLKISKDYWLKHYFNSTKLKPAWHHDPI